MKLGSVLATLLSVLAITVEIMFFFGKFENTWLHTLVVNQKQKSYFIQSISHLFIFGYVFYSTNYGLFKFKVIDILNLYWNQNTDQFGLMYSCM